MLKGIIWDLIEKFSNQGVSFGISILLARLLSPQEFGLIGMVMVFVQMSHMFLDMGFGSALVQRQDVKSIHYSSVFYLNLGVGIFLYLTFYLSAGIIAEFYNKPELDQICKALAVLFVFDSLIIVQHALFAKNMNFKTPAIVRVTATFISGIIGVYLAFNGYGVWSLVYQNLISAGISVVGIWIGSSWRPTFQFSFSVIKELWKYSSNLFFSGVIDSVFSKLDVLIIGKIFSAQTLGFYSRAQSFNSLIVQYSSGSLLRVFFPAISKIQNDVLLIKELYINVVSLVSFLIFGVIGFFFLSAHEIFLLIFTSKWLPSVEYFEILLLGGFIFPLNNIMISILSGRGKSGKILQLEIIKKLLMAFAFASGFIFGIKGFLYALIIVSFFTLLINMTYVKAEIKYSVFKQFLLVVQYLLITLASVIIAKLTYQFIIEIPILKILVMGIVFSLFYIFLNFIFRTYAILFIYNKIKHYYLKSN